MTQLLARAFTEAAQLPAAEQKSLATRILADLEQRAHIAGEDAALPLSNVLPLHDAGRQLAAVRSAAKSSFPTGDIEQILAEIERGYLSFPTE